MLFKVNSVLESFLHYLYPYTKCSCRVMKKISNKFSKGMSTIIIFFWGGGGVGGVFLQAKNCITTLKVWPNVFKFQSIFIFAIHCTDNRKQFQCLNMILNNKTRSLFLKFNRCEKSFSFLKR